MIPLFAEFCRTLHSPLSTLHATRQALDRA